jgi:hypothetical protein
LVLVTRQAELYIWPLILVNNLCNMFPHLNIDKARAATLALRKFLDTWLYFGLTVILIQYVLCLSLLQYFLEYLKSTYRIFLISIINFYYVINKLIILVSNPH